VFYGEYLENAEGEDVVSGIRTPEPLAYLQQNYPELYQQLFKIQKDLETHYRDMQAGGPNRALTVVASPIVNNSGVSFPELHLLI
jgi:phosphoenolpyruvate synthase/pyruvate phosphate dikinase